MNGIKKLLQALDRAAGFLFTNIGGIFVAGAFVVVLFTIICRYVLHVNTGGIDEFSTYFVVCSVWVGAVICARDMDEGQIKIDLLKVFLKNDRALAVVECVWQVLAFVVMACFTKLSFTYFTYQVGQRAMLSGLRFPLFVFTGIMFLCSLIITIYEVVRFVKIGRSRVLKRRES